MKDCQLYVVDYEGLLEILATDGEGNWRAAQADILPEHVYIDEDGFPVTEAEELAERMRADGIDDFEMCYDCMDDVPDICGCGTIDEVMYRAEEENYFRPTYVEV